MKHIVPLLVIFLASMVVAYLFPPAAPWTQYHLLRATAILLVAVPTYFIGLAHGREKLGPGDNIATRWRRPLQFSLRTLLFLTMLLAVYLGVHCDRAHRQRDAARALADMYCGVIYESDLAASPSGYPAYSDLNHWGTGGKAPVPRNWSWLQEYLGRRLGADYVDRVVAVRISSHNVDEVLPHLKRLPYLRQVFIPIGSGEVGPDENHHKARDRLRRELPHVEVLFCGGIPVVG